MAIANDSAEQRKLSKEKGIKQPKMTSGMTRVPSPELSIPKDERRESGEKDKKQLEEDGDLIGKAKKRFLRAARAEAENRTEGLEDLKFIKGDQWSSADATQRAAEARPCITENRLPTFSAQITNDQRQNRPSINISPMGSRASKKDAKILRGMIRAIERDSNADVAYDTGFQNAVHNGWGYWEIATEYESEKSFNKVIVVRQISNSFNVYLDPSRTPFMLDAGWGFISEMIDREEFTRDYPDADPMQWVETGVGEEDKDWITQDRVRIANYYYMDYEERYLVMLDNGFTGWEDELDDLIAEKVKQGKLKEIDRRCVQTKKLKYCKMTAVEVLESHDCDGQYVPIIECIGTFLNINGKQVKKGIVRDAKGPQKMINYFATLETEHVALAPKAPWIMEEGQVEGHEQKWKDANRKSYAYLLYKAQSIGGKPAPPPQRQQFQGAPQGILEAKRGTIEALKAVTGIRFDATMSERMLDESGKAIRELNNNANLGAYHYIDNFARALKNTGIVMVDMIPYTYDTRRIISILDDSGSEDHIEIYPAMDKAHDEVPYQAPENPSGKINRFNPKVGRYQVTVTIGPSYATKRTENMDSLLEFARAVPEARQLIMDLIAKYSDWEGAEELANRLAKAVDPKFLTPDREDMSPQTQALLQSLHQQVQQANNVIGQMQQALQNEQKNRDVIEHKTVADFIAKQTATEKKFDIEMAKLGAKFDEIQQKRDAALQGTIGRQIAELSKAVGMLQKTSPSGADGNIAQGESSNG